MCFKPASASKYVYNTMLMECNCIALDRLLLHKGVPSATRDDHGRSHLQIHCATVDFSLAAEFNQSVCQVLVTCGEKLIVLHRHRVRFYGACGASKVGDHIRNWNSCFK